MVAVISLDARERLRAVSVILKLKFILRSAGSVAETLPDEAQHRTNGTAALPDVGALLRDPEARPIFEDRGLQHVQLRSDLTPGTYFARNDERSAARRAARCAAAPPSDEAMAERDVTVVRGRNGGAADTAAPPLAGRAAMRDGPTSALVATAATVGVSGARGVGRDAIVGAKGRLGEAVAVSKLEGAR